MTEIPFARKTIEFLKIRELEEIEVREGLGMIFVKAANLLGIKEKISDINKTDIREMILTKFKNLSLEEIDYAFRLDRYSGEPVPHFQLFNSEYVAKILKKYQDWIRQTRVANQLPIFKENPKTEELSEEEKQLITINGIIDCFEKFKNTGMIEPGKNYVYDWLYEREKLPKHTSKFKARIKRKAVKMALREKEELGKTGSEIKNKIREIKSGENQLKRLCKDLVLMEFFSKLISQEKSITEII